MSQNQKDSHQLRILNYWIRSAVDRSPNAFFTAFNLNDKQHAHKKYVQMIRDSDLDENDKVDLLQEFQEWKTGNAGSTGVQNPLR